MKKIVLITLGGTISAKGKSRLDLKDYQSGLIYGKDYLEEIPELNEVAAIEIVTLDSISSTQINDTHWVKLKQLIEEFLNVKDFDGVVISHGTNTLEETAYFLHLTVNSSKPVVLVGAQRPYTAMSSDSQLNLFHAVKVAIHPASHHKGVLVVFNQQIHSAREVTKTDTYQIEGFSSGNIGPLGVIDAAHDIIYYKQPTRKHTTESAFNQLTFSSLPAIEIIYSYAGATGSLIHFISVSGKYEGIVMAGTGAGRFSKKEEEALQQAIHHGLYVARSSRVGNGRVIPIQPFDHLDLIHADNLNPQKARILLSLSLILETETNKIQQFFDEY